MYSTGKYLSEALIFASTNPQYDDRLFIELQVQCMKIPSSEHGENMLCKVQSADLTCDVIKKVAPRTVVLNLQTE